jgi:regulator of chromosome condensation
VLKVSASHEHSMALTKMNELYTWGSAMLTGIGEQENSYYPTEMAFFKSKQIMQVACGGLHTMVLTKKGSLYAWGSAEGGQLGLPGL